MTDVSLAFRPPCWSSFGRTPAWRLLTNLYKFGWNISPHKNCCDLNLGEGICIFTFFLFPESGLYLLNGFDFYFDLFWLAWYWKPAIVCRYDVTSTYIKTTVCKYDVTKQCQKEFAIIFIFTCISEKIKILLVAFSQTTSRQWHQCIISQNIRC